MPRCQINFPGQQIWRLMPTRVLRGHPVRRPNGAVQVETQHVYCLKCRINVCESSKGFVEG